MGVSKVNVLDVPHRQPWRRQWRESAHAYRCFCIYRDMGSDRSLTKAVRQYLSSPHKGTSKQQRQARRFATHPTPGKYLGAIRRTWGEWSRLRFWVSRCEKYDEWSRREAEARADKAAVDAAIEEAEENERQRNLRITEARNARSAGRSIIDQFLALIKAGELANLGMARTKSVVTKKGVDAEGKEDGTFVRTELERKGLPEILSLAIQAIAEGQKAERLELGEVTDRHETALTEATLRRLAEVVAERVPREDWESVAAEIDAIIRGGRGDGKPD